MSSDLTWCFEDASVDEVALLTIAPGVLPALLVGGLLAITIWLTLLSIQPRRGDV